MWRYPVQPRGCNLTQSPYHTAHFPLVFIQVTCILPITATCAAAATEAVRKWFGDVACLRLLLSFS